MDLHIFLKFSTNIANSDYTPHNSQIRLFCLNCTYKYNYQEFVWVQSRYTCTGRWIFILFAIPPQYGNNRSTFNAKTPYNSETVELQLQIVPFVLNLLKIQKLMGKPVDAGHKSSQSKPACSSNSVVHVHSSHGRSLAHSFIESSDASLPPPACHTRVLSQENVFRVNRVERALVK